MIYMSYKKHDLLILREHLMFTPGFLVGSILLLFLVFCVVSNVPCASGLSILSFLFGFLLYSFTRYIVILYVLTQLHIHYVLTQISPAMKKKCIIIDSITLFLMYLFPYCNKSFILNFITEIVKMCH